MKLLLLAALMAVFLFAGPGNAHAKWHPGCKTKACSKRVDIKLGNAVAEPIAHVSSMKAFVRPFKGWLAKVRGCETRGMSFPHNYRANTGNGFYGAYQFDRGTWHSVGGRGFAHQAPPVEQDYRATLLRMRRGVSPWPVCG